MCDISTRLVDRVCTLCPTPDIILYRKDGLPRAGLSRRVVSHKTTVLPLDRKGRVQQAVGRNTFNDPQMLKQQQLTGKPRLATCLVTGGQRLRCRACHQEMQTRTCAMHHRPLAVVRTEARLPMIDVKRRIPRNVLVRAGEAAVDILQVLHLYTAS